MQVNSWLQRWCWLVLVLVSMTTGHYLQISFCMGEMGSTTKWGNGIFASRVGELVEGASN